MRNPDPNLFPYTSCITGHLSHDTIALVGGWARRRLIQRATVRRLRRLHFDAILLATVVALIRAAAVVSGVCVVRLRRVRGSRLVVVVGCCVIVVAGHGARGPACAVEGLATGLAAATGC
jgi:hypothetical protein